MNQITQNNSNIVSGSILDRAMQTNQTFAESFLDCEAVIMTDVSASMDTHDCHNGQSRFEAANEQLKQLQAEMPGKIAVCSFSNSAKFCAAGLPKTTEGTTDMVEALEFMKDFDGAGIRLILISDGEPDDEAATIRLAEKFESKIDTIFVGNEMSSGREFLRRLSMATGGVSIVQNTDKIHLLSSNVRLLLGA